MWLRFVFLAALLTPLMHIVVLFLSGGDAVASPISELSRPPWGVLHTMELVLFGAAHIVLAICLKDVDSGKLWPYGRALLVASGVVLFYIAYFFAVIGADSSGERADNDPLWIVATLTGVAMGALQPGLARRSRSLGIFGSLWLGVWLWLVMLAIFVNDSWIGAYERLVGLVYVAWIMGLAAGLQRNDTHPQAS